MHAMAIIMNGRPPLKPANPFEMGFGDMIDFGHDFVGRDALHEVASEGAKRHRIGVLIDGGKLTPNTHHLDLMRDGAKVGVVSEIVNSPRLGRPIGIGLAQVDITTDTTGLSITTPNGARDVTVTDLPFL